MEDSKELIANVIVNALDESVDIEQIKEKIEIPKDNTNGDLAYPCFGLAKV